MYILAQSNHVKARIFTGIEQCLNCPGIAGLSQC